ncbi:hypothetical protein M0R45_032113 [Rubus argutus]|uniref:Uncharacterized protein n=1 Tax=Rubus argutus TaxID=59490 RepID=A0AAW1WI48_RUBAR
MGRCLATSAPARVLVQSRLSRSGTDSMIAGPNLAAGWEVRNCIWAHGERRQCMSSSAKTEVQISGGE